MKDSKESLKKDKEKSKLKQAQFKILKEIFIKT
jgi:hypothetical protein